MTLMRISWKMHVASGLGHRSKSESFKYLENVE